MPMMNHRKFSVSFLLLAAMFLTHPVLLQAGTLPERDTMWTKAGRGLGNLTLGFYEVIAQPREMAKSERWPIAVLGGTIKGVFRGAMRTVVGAVELVTFPLPVPHGYAPIIEPEYPVQDTYPLSHRWPKWGPDAGTGPA